MVRTAPSTFVDTTPARFRHWSVAAFGAWNAGIWLTRIRNILTDDDLATGGRLAWLVPAVGFGAVGVLALVAFWRGRPAYARPLAAAALVTLLYWPVRTVLILLHDHETGFKVVHVVLAVVSVGLALLLGRRLVRTDLVPRGAYR